MNRIPRTSLEQWAVLRAVIEAGGFAQAADLLNRSQSSISYAVARLHERVGIDLIRIDGRKAHLTPAGRTLLNDAIPLIEDMLRLEARVRTVKRGVEAEITLLIESLFPRSALFAALKDLQQDYFDTEVHLHTASRIYAAGLSTQRHDLALALWSPDSPTSEWMIDVELIPVARADHPLATVSDSLEPVVVSHHRVATITGQHIAADAAVRTDIPSRQWRANSVESAIDMVDSGLCWGWLPAHMIESGLAEGRLVRLRFGQTRTMRLCLNLADPASAGPATRALATLLRTHAEHYLRRSA